MRAWGRVAGAVVALLALPATARADAPPLHDAAGLQVLAQNQLSPRLVDVRVHTAALPGPASIRILLPAGYAQHPRRRYPVLYLLHGTSGGAPDWTKSGDAEYTTMGRPLIVVMPDIALNDDGGGWCTNWPNGQYKWETFHIDQLIPWIDANLRTRATRTGRAIAGLSQGGFCSMSYAARHPDLFAVALAYSGAPDIASDDPDVIAGSTLIINGTEVGLDHVAPNSMFGDRATNEINWAAHDPATLANNLRATRMYLWTGNGVPGPYDASPNPSAMAIEGAVHRDNEAFHARLNALGIPSFYDDYGPGTHSWSYWARDLRESMDPLMEDFAHPAPAPSMVTYTSADNAYRVYGWQVAMHRDAREFSTLQDASCGGFALAGSGSATVTTPACLSPGARYRVALAGDKVTPRTLVATAGPDHRATLDVPLGPSNPYQQDTAQAELAGTAVYRTRVTLTRLATPRRHKRHHRRHRHRVTRRAARA